MTTDLWMLVASAALHWVTILVAATPRLLINGFGWGFGPRDVASAEVPAWAQRAQRASTNMNENLILMAILVLVVHVAGLANETTALGAQLFFWARLAHPLTYMIGVPVVRTLVWMISIAGLFLIASALL
jgi:uncharacterized MAPEG superfamily protein